MRGLLKSLGYGELADGCEVSSIEVAHDRRARLVLRVRGEGESLLAGFPGRKQPLVQFAECPTSSPLAERVATAAIATLAELGTPGIEAVAIHVGQDEARALLTLVSPSARVARAQDLARRLADLGVTSVAANQSEPGRRLFGRRNVPLAGAFPFVDSVAHRRFRLHATTPFWPSHGSGERVLSDAADLIGKGSTKALVLRAGNGLTAGLLAELGYVVTALEDRPEIANEAEGTVRDLGHEVAFLGDGNRKALESLSGSRTQLALLESPRSGFDVELIAPLVRLVAPPRIVVVASGQQALENDLRSLTEFGYRLDGFRAHLADPFLGEVCAVARFVR